MPMSPRALSQTGTFLASAIWHAQTCVHTCHSRTRAPWNSADSKLTKPAQSQATPVHATTWVSWNSMHVHTLLYAPEPTYMFMKAYSTVHACVLAK